MLSAARENWILGPKQDFLFFIGPALFGVFAFAVAWSTPSSAPIFLWIWLLGFDGPHMAAGYARTYFDPGMRRTRRPLLLASLGAFLVGPAVLVGCAFAGTKLPFMAFLAAMSVYGVHHLVRQHWGFVAIYGARSRARATRMDRALVYAGSWIPYLGFVTTHPAIGELAGLQGSILPRPVAAICAAAWLAMMGTALVRLVADAREARPRQKSIYVCVVILFNGFVYGILAAFEPMYPGARGADQVFMMLAVAAGVFHSAQYIALVGHVRAGTERRSPWPYIAGCLLFSIPYFALAGATGVYPGFHLFSSGDLALAIWYGFALHHYWLDERIWHISKDPQLARALGIEKR